MHLKKKSMGKGKLFPFLSFLLILFALLLCLSVFAICVGKYPVTPMESLKIMGNALLGKSGDYPLMMENVVLRLRLPRIAASIFVGAALSVSGASYQGIFQNSLVSPDFLGVSSGACIGAALAILLSLTSGYISIFAFFGGLIAVFITMSIPAMIGNRANIVLVLSGIIVSSMMSSILGFIKFVADPETQLASITYWTMGSFSYVKPEDLIPLSVILIPPAILLLLMSWWIDILSMGDEEARALGANVTLIRSLIILFATLLTAGSVCISGTISWVGLIVPHFARMIVGPSGRRLIPVSLILGGIFMLLVDTLTRVIGSNEMPVSIMTGIIGAPFFCFLLWRQREAVK